MKYLDLTGLQRLWTKIKALVQPYIKEVEFKNNVLSFTKGTGNITDVIIPPEHPDTHPASMITGLANVAKSGSYTDLSNRPSIPSIAGLASESYVNDKIDAKVDKVSGKGLSTNDYTTAEKNKLAGLANYTLPAAGSSLGGVKTGGDVTISNGVITVNNASHTHTVANIDGLQDTLNSKAASGHTHSISDLTQGYLNTHPENSPTIVPFINNDLAFLDKKGGAYSVYSTTSTDFTVASLTQGAALSLSGMGNMFDGTPSYAMISTTGSITVVIDMTLHKMFTYSNKFYIDFGNAGWRAKGVAVYAMNSNTETKYTSKGSTTANAKGNWYCDVSHSSKNSSGATVEGFNKLRVVLSNFNNTSSTSGKRIAQVGLYNYGSAGVSETFVSRGGSTMYGDLNTKNLYPTATNASNLGSSSKQYNTIYGKTIYENGTALSTKYAANSLATTSANGLMSSADKTKLNNTPTFSFDPTTGTLTITSS